jgi:hydroxymethylglutaryl-CoA lyase
MRAQIEIVEVGPRDGLQNQDAVLPAETKIAFIERLIGAGARRIEIASFVNGARVPQMADAEAVVAGVPARPGLVRIGLVLNRRGLDRALATDVEEIGMVAVASDSFGRRNQKQTADESVSIAREVIRTAKTEGRRVQVTIAVAFGCPFEGEVPQSRVLAMASALAAEGPSEIALADTVGVGVPTQVRSFCRTLKRELAPMPLRFHFHNTRNAGLANAFVAADEGADTLDASAGGIGGCPFAPAATGNIPTEDLLYMLERSGVRTGYDLGSFMKLTPWLAKTLGVAVLPAMVSRTAPFPPVA